MTPIPTAVHAVEQFERTLRASLSLLHDAPVNRHDRRHYAVALTATDLRSGTLNTTPYCTVHAGTVKPGYKNTGYKNILTYKNGGPGLKIFIVGNKILSIRIT